MPRSLDPFGRTAPRHTRDVPRTSKKPRKLGRPPATDSAETRRRILAIARETFAVHGYEVTTNRDIANQAGVTPAALYHYFPSKADLYVAVLEDAQGLVSARFNDAVAGRDTFLDRFDAVLDAAHLLNGEDPSYARFLGAVRVDARRHPEMRVALDEAQLPTQKFVVELVEEAVAAGDVARSHRSMVLSFILTTLAGLTDVASDDLRHHRTAIAAAKSALRGSLLTDPR